MRQNLLKIRAALLLLIVACFSYPQTTIAQVIHVVSTYNFRGVPDNLDPTNDVIDELFLDDINLSLPERKPVPTYNSHYLANGNETNVVMAQTGEVIVTFVHEGAGWKNTLGYYTYDTASPPATSADIDTIHIIYPNSSYLYGGGGLRSGNRVNLGSFTAGTGIGWVLIARGWNRGVTSGIYRVYSEPDFNPETNPSLRQHNVMLRDPNRNLILMGFEDINREWGSCDNDFNDAIFYIKTDPVTALGTDNYPRVATTNFPCNSVPENLQITEVGKFRVNACWNTIPGASTYRFRFREADGPGPWQTRTVNAPDTCIDLRHAIEWCNSLSPCTDYEWQVSVACNNGVQTANSLSHRFITLCDCYEPTGLTTINISDDSATLNWSLSTNGEYYKIRYREKNGPGAWEFRTLSNVSSHIITGLQPNTTYEWNVSVVCEDGLFSGNAPAGGFQEFTTTNVGGQRLGQWADSHCFSDLNEIDFSAHQGISTLEGEEKRVLLKDLNKDELPDLVVAYGEDQSKVSIFLNESQSDRTRFSNPVHLDAVAGIQFIDVGDLNGDGLPDLFYSDYKGSSLHYHLNASGAGNIAFGPALELYTGIAPKGIGAADFDDDGKVDFAIVHFGNDRLTTLMNTTEGASLAFELRKSFKTSLMPEQLLLSDFDQDGLTDIAVIGAEEALLTVFKNRCTADTVLFHGGNFRLEGLPVAMGHGDFNQDGKPDLAVVSGEGKLLQLFENKGQPGNNMFVNVHSYLLNEQASGVSMADVNFDGYTDLMVSYEDASGVAVFQQLLGQEGDFSAPREISVSQAPYAALPLQWENKTTTDLLVANQSASALGILKNTTPETVLTQPEDAKVNSGSNAYFHIETSTGLWTYQWQAKEGEHFYDLTDDQRYQNATTPELTVLEADADMDETVYRCLVLMDGCVYKISEQARLNVASALADAADAWMVYPNPSLDNAYLVIPADVLTESVLRVELLDQEGKQVFLESWNLSEEGNHKALPISGFAKGNYFLKVYNEDGKLLYSEKVVAL